MGPFMLILQAWLWTEVVQAGAIRILDEHPCRTYTKDDQKYLDCNEKGLADLPDGFDYGVNVVLLSNNNFGNFPPILEKLTSVKILDISGNHINSPLPTYMQNWLNLQILNLSNNNYETWSHTGITNIHKLDLSRNKINLIEDDSFTGFPDITYLDLSENRIYDLAPDTFSKNSKLGILNLSRNYFSAIPSFQFTSLRRLYLSNCQITKINEDSLIGMHSLLEIDLSMNEIEYLPDNLASDTLQELVLAYNWINKLSDRTFSSLPHLAVLDMRGNEFKEVWSTSYFSSNPFLRTVYVKGNRWSCEEFSVNLLLTYEYLTKNVPKVADKSSLICFSPTNVTQLSWQDAYIKTWHGDKENTETYYVIAAIIGIIIGIVLTSIVCRFLASANQPPGTQTPTSENTALTSNGTTVIPRAESIVMRVPLREDLPPTYDEALLMPQLNASFHSLPDFIDEEESAFDYRRSRSIGDLTDYRPRQNNRRSVRRTVEIRIES